MAYFTKKRGEVALVHTAVGTALLAVSATICPPVVAIWWCHLCVAVGDTLIHEQK